MFLYFQSSKPGRLRFHIIKTSICLGWKKGNSSREMGK